MEDGVLGDKRIKVMGVIPARYNSTRLPGKPLEVIHGKPMIYWVAKRVEMSSLESYVVATDNDKIATVCTQYGIPCLMTSETCFNGTERVAEVSCKTDADFYINIQGDEPCIEPNAIDALLRSARSIEPVQFVQAVAPIRLPSLVNDPSVVKVAISDSGDAVYFSRSPIPYVAEWCEGNFFRCLGLYLYSRGFLRDYRSIPPSRLEKIERIEQLRVIESGMRIRTVQVEDNGFSVDTPKDLLFARSLDISHFKYSRA
jgi:3-deoxy-D-manno-octulosonate cytidylyltransferase